MKILIADDSLTMRRLVMRTLHRAGLVADQVVEAANGKEALDLIQSERPDLSLLDWNMPEMTGIEVLETLQAQGFRTKVGFVTSEGSAAFRDRAYAAGALFLISKPFTVESFELVLDMVEG